MPTILVVEDNADNLNMITRRLRKKSFEVISAVDGEIGLEKALTEQPDLILLDIELPKMDGRTVVGLLKKNEATKNIPVIALTAFAMAGDRESILKAGCDDYASKPLDFSGLLEKMRKYVGSSV